MRCKIFWLCLKGNEPQLHLLNDIRKEAETRAISAPFCRRTHLISLPGTGHMQGRCSRSFDLRSTRMYTQTQGFCSPLQVIMDGLWEIGPPGTNRQKASHNVTSLWGLLPIFVVVMSLLCCIFFRSLHVIVMSCCLQSEAGPGALWPHMSSVCAPLACW